MCQCPSVPQADFPSLADDQCQPDSGRAPCAHGRLFAKKFPFDQSSAVSGSDSPSHIKRSQAVKLRLATLFCLAVAIPGFL